ncbi:MAG: dynamin family protein [Deltaproteobacteria bacterium]|nr:dynamin family protein [Deltaproteobacteria bacterium]
MPTADPAAPPSSVRDVVHARSPLARLAALAHEAGIEHVATDAANLAARLAEGRFYVACVGQFKRGKSTLLNALVGDSVLPTGVVPVTAVVTVVRHGAPGARVRFADGGWEKIDRSHIAAYVTEEENPENRRGVLGVEVFVPSPLLATGMCLVDTPGIGSTILGNTAATRSFVPHVDAAVIVLGADPPISADELALVAQLTEQRVEHLVFVLNKADRLPDSDRREARAFIERVLEEQLKKPLGPVLEVSAIAAADQSEGGVSRDWRKLYDMLRSLARDAGSHLIRAAEVRGISVYADRLLHALSEERAALVRPLDESERRIATLKSCVADAERALRDLGSLLRAEQDRLEASLTARQQEFLTRAIPVARTELRRVIDTLPEEGRSRLCDSATQAAQDVFRQCLERWRGEEQPAAEEAYAEGAQRFVWLADAFLERLAASGDPALAALPQRVAPELELRARSRLYYTEMLTLTARSPLKRFLDLVRPRERLRRNIEREIGAYLERLVSTNAARLTNDLRDRVRESRDRLEIELRGYLHDVYRAAERALERARERRAVGESTVRAEIERVDALTAEVTALRAADRGGANDGDSSDSGA